VLGLCLCQACRRLAERAGLDPDGVRSALRAGARAALEAAGEVDAADDLLARLCAAHPEVEAYAGLRAAAVVDNVVAAQGAFGGRVALVGSGSVSAERLPLLAAVTPAPPATGDVELLSLAYGEPEVAAADIARYRSLGWPADRHVVCRTAPRPKPGSRRRWRSGRGASAFTTSASCRPRAGHGSRRSPSVCTAPSDRRRDAATLRAQQVRQRRRAAA
jgi:hypothetical protein